MQTCSCLFFEVPRSFIGNANLQFSIQELSYTVDDRTNGTGVDVSFLAL